MGREGENQRDRAQANARPWPSQTTLGFRRKSSTRGMAAFWPGAAIHQAAYALLSSLFLGTAVLWSFWGLATSLGVLAIWWENESRRSAGAAQGLAEDSLPVRLWRRIEPWLRRTVSARYSRASLLGRLQQLGFGRRVKVMIPGFALASMVGLPLSIGALGRWQLYASLLEAGNGLLGGLVVADTLLAAGIWCVLVAMPGYLREQRFPLAPSLAMVAFVTLSVVLGTAPGILAGRFAFDPAVAPDVSLWGLGSVYLIPWILGAWLAHVSARLTAALTALGRIVGLDWLYRVGTGLAGRLGSGVYWLGQIGEGEGWWGWVLIVLGLGTLFLSGR